MAAGPELETEPETVSDKPVMNRRLSASSPCHPGEVIDGMMAAMNISDYRLARALNVAPSTVRRLRAGKLSVTAEIAIKLSVALGHSAAFWMAQQSDYSLWLAAKTVNRRALCRLTPEKSRSKTAD